MSALIAVGKPCVLPITPELLVKVRSAESLMLQLGQVPIRTEHVLHGGMYTRTVRVPAGVGFAGALIKRPTMLIVKGDVRMLVNGGWAELEGYNVIPAMAGRKQVFVTYSDVAMTMIFPCTARTIEEAEAEFTDEAELLLSRRQDNGDTITITGE